MVTNGHTGVGGSSEQFLNSFEGLVNHPDGASDVALVHLVIVNAQLGVDGRDEIGNVDRPLDDLPAILVGYTERPTSLERRRRPRRVKRRQASGLDHR